MHAILLLLAAVGCDTGLARPGVEFKVFQFPADKIPRIDGSVDDWAIVPDSYAIGADQLRETVTGLGDKRDPADLDVKVNDSPKVFIQNSDHFPFSLRGIQAVWAVTSHPAGGGGSWGHTAADTLDKLEPRLMRQSAAAITRLLLRMSASAETLPRGRKTAEQVKQSLIDAGMEKSLRFGNHWPF